MEDLPDLPSRRGISHEQKKHIYIYTLYTHVFSAKAIETCDSKWICCNPFWYSGTGW